MGRPAIIELEPKPLPDEELMARIFRGMSDVTRLKILRVLLDGPRTQTEIVDEVGISQGRISQHLSCLVWCGYLSSERNGRTVTYEIANPIVDDLMRIGERFLDTTEGEISCCRIVPAGETSE